MQRQLANGVDVNARDEYQWTPLHSAAFDGRLAVVELLLANGAELNATDAERKTALFHAAERKGCCPDGSDRHGVAELLLAKGAVVDLFSACLLGRMDQVRAALEQDPAIVDSTIGNEKQTVLHVAAWNGQSDVVVLLLEHGATVGAKTDPWEATPLHYPRDVLTATVLIDGEADIHAADSVGHTPLHNAARSDALALAQLYVSRGADVNASGKGSGTPLVNAAMMGSADVARFLLENGADVNARGGQEFTPLQFAALNGYPEVVKILLDYNPNVNAPGPYGTALETAMMQDRTGITDLIRGHLADE